MNRGLTNGNLWGLYYVWTAVSPTCEERNVFHYVAQIELLIEYVEKIWNLDTLRNLEYVVEWNIICGNEFSLEFWDTHGNTHGKMSFSE
jgi:hypothetical protein